MIFMPDTISDPRAMVVHSHDARVANTTMMSSGGSKRYTVKTVPPLNKADCALWELFVNKAFNLTPLAISHAHCIKIRNFSVYWL